MVCLHGGGYSSGSGNWLLYDGTPLARSQDVAAALRWVRSNIDRFGGDPINVTIFEQSGGGGKVAALMGMPGASGRFHRAIGMSGAFASFARKGNASHEGLPEWPAYDTEHRTTMILDDDCRVIENPHAAEHAVLARITDT